MNVNDATFCDYDFIIVGCGFSGSILARRLAEELDKKVLVLERRAHIAGNMFDEINERGVMIQRYGVHVFHTDHDEVFDYLSRFTEWFEYNITCLADIKGKKVPVPFNFTCIDMFFQDNSEILKEKLIKMFNKDRIPVLDLINSDDPDIREFGKFLFENDYRPYTSKQWGRDPSDIDTSILERVKIALSYDDRFFTDRYQCVPKDGFSKMFENILDHPNITVKLNTDFLDDAIFEENVIRLPGIRCGTPIIYTGELDALFGYALGNLPYRTLDFRYETHNMEFYQNAPFIVYPMHSSMTRITEFKYITGQLLKDVTTIVKEYPKEYVHGDKLHEPFYPVIWEENRKLYEKYLSLSKKYSNIILCGRLADYRYYDMDITVLRAFDVYNEIKRQLNE